MLGYLSPLDERNLMKEHRMYKDVAQNQIVNNRLSFVNHGFNLPCAANKAHTEATSSHCMLTKAGRLPILRNY